MFESDNLKREFLKFKHNLEESAAKKPEMSERDATIHNMNEEVLRGSTLNNTLAPW